MIKEIWIWQGSDCGYFTPRLDYHEHFPHSLTGRHQQWKRLDQMKDSPEPKANTQREGISEI